MRRFVLLLSVGVSLFLLGACRAKQPEYRPTATVKDIMDSIVDPQADIIWNSVATIVSAAGTEERAPHTDEEWAAVRRSAVQLVEAPNLLLMLGRRVAQPGQKSDNPKIELEPEEIEQRINADRASFETLARGLQDSAVLVLKAIDAKDVQGVTDAGEKIDTACENCHLKYWYPNQVIPPIPK